MSESHEPDVSSLGSHDKSNEPDLPPTTEKSFPEAEKAVNLKETAGESYGVEAPAARVYPTSYNTETLPSDSSGNESEGVSLETIYSRRRAADNNAEGTPTPDFPKPIPLPSHPFMTRLFRPLINPGMILKLGCLGVLLWGLLLISVPLFQRSTRSMFKEGMQQGASITVDLKAPDGTIRKNIDVTADELTGKLSKTERLFLGKKSGILFGAWRRFGYLFLFTFIPWGLFAVPFFLQITEQTSDGDDKIGMWPDLSLLPMLARFSWFLLLSVTAGVPGYLLFGTVGMARFGFVISFLLIFPVFYLSTSGTDSFFCLLSRNVLRGMKLSSAAWRCWILISFLLTLVTFLFFFLLTGNGVFHIWGISHLVLLTLTCAFFLVLSVFTFFRCLGRLAWVMRDCLNAEDSRNSKDVSL